MGRKNTQTSGLAVRNDMFNRLGIKQDKIEIWEDGMRTSGGEGSYEWWYTDAEFDDGTTIVVVFYSKYKFDTTGPAHPTATIDINFADGTRIFREIDEAKEKLIDASKDICNVKIDESYIRYVDGDYELFFKDNDLEYTAHMKSMLPMWRPETGHVFFGDEKEHFFAWLPAQPSSQITAALKIGNKVTKLKGSGYHDHNWGNIAINKVMNHWYWCRANIGGYSIIASDIISEKEYGYTRQPIFMIGKDGKIFKTNQAETIIKRDGTHLHETTGKFIDDHLTFIQRINGTKYKVEFIRKRDIEASSLLDTLPHVQKKLAKMLGANPTYVRILGDVRLTIIKNGKKEVIEHEGLWEQMFLGNNKDFKMG